MRFWPKRKRDTKLRLTGANISATGVGFNWQQEASDHQRAREVLHRLEDHRMLYDRYEAEHVQPVIESAERLRDYLAEQIPHLPALSRSEVTVEAPGRQADLPGLFRQACGRPLRTLRRRP
jgi:hypothetical protein